MSSEKKNEDPRLRPLVVYGQMVVEIFSSDVDLDDLVCLLPAQGGGCFSCEKSSRDFFSHAQEKWSETLQAIAVLRNSIAEERHQVASFGSSRPNDIKTPILDRFLVFQNALKERDEESIIDNPFFLLMKMIFQLNMQSARGAFKETIRYAISEHYRVDTCAISSRFSVKPFVSILFLVLSSWAVFCGVNEFLQRPVSQEIFRGVFLGVSGETLRHVAGLVAGFLLSLAILDFKDRLLQGFAEKGQLWGGLVYSVVTNPRWIILAALLTFLSVYTSHDGIVSLISRYGDLQKQQVENGGYVGHISGNAYAGVANHDLQLVAHILIVVLLIIVNFGEVLIFARSTIKAAQKDGSLADNSDLVFSKFLDGVVGEIDAFFERREILISLLSWLPRPSKLLITDAFFTWLYTVNFKLRYGEAGIELLTILKIWFSRLFRFTVRKNLCYGICAMDLSLSRIRLGLNHDKCKFLEILYPDLLWDSELGETFFIQFGDRLLSSMKKGRKRFDRNLKRSCGVPLCKKISFRERFIHRKNLKSKIREEFETTLNMAYGELSHEQCQERRESYDFNGHAVMDTGLCSCYGSLGLLRVWECDAVCHKNIVIDVFVYFVYYLAYRLFRLFFLSAINENENLFPWSYKKWIHDFCMSLNENAGAKRSAEMDNIDDILNISMMIPILVDRDIKNILKKIDQFDSLSIRPWKVTMLHYADVLGEMEEEIKMIMDARMNTVDYSQLGGSSTILYMSLRYKSPRIFSLREQFNIIANQINQTSEYVEELDFLNQQRNLFFEDIEDKCVNISRLLMEVRISLLGGGVDYSVWRSVSGDKLVYHVTSEVQNIQNALYRYRKMDIVDHTKDIFSELSLLKDRSKKLYGSLKDIRYTLTEAGQHPNQ
ncbi:MAG: hypothetical protein HQL64_12220 [Magnetococcales bacterium]|nr:hypothetical protein [Magnetococcales bacterium]